MRGKKGGSGKPEKRLRGKKSPDDEGGAWELGHSGVRGGVPLRGGKKWAKVRRRGKPSAFPSEWGSVFDQRSDQKTLEKKTGKPFPRGGGALSTKKNDN